MPPDLSRLIQELKNETCPRPVREAVRRRISAPESSPGWLRYGVAAAALAMICCVSAWHWQADVHARQKTELAKQTLESLHTVNQAKDALGLIGSLLTSAGAHAEKEIFNRAVPPLRNSLQTVKLKIIPHLEL